MKFFSHSAMHTSAINRDKHNDNVTKLCRFYQIRKKQKKMINFVIN